MGLHAVWCAAFAERADSAQPRGRGPSEQAQTIVAAMLRGVPPARRRCVQIELDRRRAIRLAARLARPGDTVLLLGKGHEATQETGGTKQPWDDPAELRAALDPDNGRRIDAAQRLRAGDVSALGL